MRSFQDFLIQKRLYEKPQLNTIGETSFVSITCYNLANKSMKILASLFTGIVFLIGFYIVLANLWWYTVGKYDFVGVSFIFASFWATICTIIALIVSVIYGIYRQINKKSKRNFTKPQLWIVFISTCITAGFVLLVQLNKMF
jgi:hypothetical protein